MAHRYRWVVTFVLAAAIYVLLTWYDGVLRVEPPSDFASHINVVLSTVGILALAAGMISIAALAWWARSLLVGVTFGVLGLIVVVSVLITTSDWQFPPPHWLFQPLADWLRSTDGPLGVMVNLGAAMAVSGVIGLYRWRTTRA